MMRTHDDVPVHPDAVPAVAALKTRLRDCTLAVEAADHKRRANHQALQTSRDDVERLLAEAEQLVLHRDWLKAQAEREQVKRQYRAAYDRAAEPWARLWQARHQAAVQELIDALQGAAFEKNQAVLRVVAEAAEAGVRLPTDCLLPQLLREHLDQTLHVWRREAGLPPEE